MNNQNQFSFWAIVLIVIIIMIILIIKSKKRKKKKIEEEVDNSITIDMIPTSHDEEEKYNFSELLDDIQKDDVEEEIKIQSYPTSVIKELETLKTSIENNEQEILVQLKSATKIAIKLQDIVQREKFNGDIEKISGELLDVKQMMIERLESYTDEVNKYIDSLDEAEKNEQKKELKRSLIDLKLELEVYRKIETKILEKLNSN